MYGNNFAKNRQRITMISDLPDIDDLEAGYDRAQPQYQPPHAGYNPNNPGLSSPERMPDPMEAQFQKHIRMTQKSGAGREPPYDQEFDGVLAGGPDRPGISASDVIEPANAVSPDKPTQMRDSGPPTPRELNCVDVAKHVEGCPVCTRLYNNDRTVYVIVIVILVVLCLLLLKKVLDV